VSLSATGLDLPNDRPVILALEVTNNQRNLQIPIDDLAAGFDIKVTWAGSTEAVDLDLRSTRGSGQLWVKPQPNGALAAFVLNHGSSVLDYSIDFKKLNLTQASYDARDIWAHTSNGSAANHFNVSVPGYDSAFLVFSPSIGTVNLIV